MNAGNVPVRSSLHIRGMKKNIILLVSLMILTSCGENTASELTPYQLNIIAEGAGQLARSLAYLPSDSNWTPAPGENIISELELMSLEHTDVWPAFFRAAADTAMKFDQLLQQAQREAIQEEML